MPQRRGRPRTDVGSCRPALRYRVVLADLARVMPVSRPLVALLAATVLVFALYTVALKPASSSGGGGGAHVGAYQSAIAKARAVQGVVNKAAARDGGTPAPATAPTSKTSSAPAHPAPVATHSPSTKTTRAGAGQPASASSTQVSRTSGNSAAPAQPTVASLAAPGTVVGKLTPTPPGMTAAERFRMVQVGLQQHRVLALLFYNPASADDRAVESEMSSIPTHGGAVVKLAVPLQELAAYSSLLSQLPVNYSPTLVLIDRHGHAQEISGFADSFELDQRVAGLLGS